MMMSRLIKQAVFFIVSLIIILGLTEWYLRYAIPGWHTARMPQEVIDQHTNLGFRYDRDLMWYWKELPNRNQVINEYGFRRKKNMSRQKPPNITRVIVFGDSQTYGGGVEYNQTFSYFAEQQLGESWEILNAGLSGYRSLNIFRLMRQRMLEFEPDIFVVNSMLYDSPAEDGQLHNTTQFQDKNLFLREWLWNSRLNYVFQLSLRSFGFGYWEDLPWPIHLHEFSTKQQSASKDFGNHLQIANWGRQRGITVIFMEYAFRDRKSGGIICSGAEMELPASRFSTCAALKQADKTPQEIFIDTNHLTPQGAKIIGTALADYLQEQRPFSTAR